jgi:hypothetical protein
VPNKYCGFVQIAVQFLQYNYSQAKTDSMRNKRLLNYLHYSTYWRFLVAIMLFTTVHLSDLSAFAQKSGFERPSKTLGIGVIKLLPEQILHAFKDPYCQKAMASYAFGSRDGLMQPKFFDKNFGLCYFVCTERTANYYKILVNPLDELYIKIDKEIEFLEWGNFLENDHFTYIGRKDWYNNRIRLQPNDSAAEINYERKYDTMIPLKIQGDWLKVKFFNNHGRQVGWIRWKSDTKLLINFQLSGQ